MADTFDSKGYEKLKNSEEYVVAMLKVNVQSYGTARDYFQKNGLKSGTVTLTNPKIVSQNFVSHGTIAKVIPDPLGAGAAIINEEMWNVKLKDILMESLRFREENPFKYKYINPIF